MPTYTETEKFVEDVQLHDLIDIGGAKFEVLEKFENELQIRLELFCVAVRCNQPGLPKTAKSAITIPRGLMIMTYK